MTEIDDEVDYMVAIHLGPSKIVVEGKTETCYRSVELSGTVPVCKKGFLDVLYI